MIFNGNIVIDDEQHRVLEISNGNLLFRKHISNDNEVKKIYLGDNTNDFDFTEEYLLKMSDDELTVGYNKKQKFSTINKTIECEQYFSYKRINNKTYLDVILQKNNDVERISVRPEMEDENTKYTYEESKIDGEEILTTRALLNENAVQNLVDVTFINNDIIETIEKVKLHFKNILFEFIDDKLFEMEVTERFFNYEDSKVKKLEK